ncbi:ComEA family DNA-binding protein [Galbibacter mesophilus]|uniref:ComEA family DNA-binding protein n=1 Tax=Galbibacter mesophilus TaxID=379069 RepID=UPI00191EE66F|nr:helix-hairpin-helix domain-containing protein [Galbibacter mesophilus]MCM5661621.1 helix-hairpin-helix domain-containing protein [Galbibacter mesophilus]
MSHFRFSKSQRSGIFFLILGVLLIQSFSIWGHLFKKDNVVFDNNFSSERETFAKLIMYPFNPNYLSDFKGYSMGLSTEEIDRLWAFRNSGKFLNSASDFQKVTKISDSLLLQLSPYLLFPKFEKRQPTIFSVKRFKKLDVNTATAKDFQKVYGVGEKLATRLIKYRSYLGGFYFLDQLDEVYGLNKEVVVRLKEHFEIRKKPSFVKLNVNTASVKQISEVTYLSWEIAKKIVTYRTKYHKIDSIAELTKLEDFPTNKLNRIELYLTTD